MPARHSHFDEVVGTWHGKTVLDLGCGGGFMAEPLAKRGATVIGIDPIEAAIAAAESHACQEGLTIDYRVGSGEAIPLADRSVDCVDVWSTSPMSTVCSTRSPAC